MICSSVKRFFTSNLLELRDWTPDRRATQNRGDVDLVESLFANRRNEEPTRQSLAQLIRNLEELENDIVHGCFDLHPNIDSSSLQSIIDVANDLVESLPSRTTSAGQAALRFFMQEIRRRAVEIFDIAAGTINTLNVEKAFNAIDELPYPPYVYTVTEAEA